MPLAASSANREIQGPPQAKAKPRASGARQANMLGFRALTLHPEPQSPKYPKPCTQNTKGQTLP